MGWVQFSDILTQIRDFLKERDTDGYWTQEELRRHANAGIQEFARRAKCVEGAWSIDVEPGIQSYTLPTSLIPGSVRAVHFYPPGEDRIRLEYLAFNKFRLNYMTYPTADRGTPYVYSLWHDCVFLGPPPDRAEYAPVKVIAEGQYTYIEMPNGEDTYQILENSTVLVGKEEVLVEVVTAASLGLTGANKVILNLPEDEDWVLCDTSSGIGTVEIRLANYILYAHLPDNNDINLYETDVQSYHGHIQIDGYMYPEEITDDDAGLEIHDAYARGPVYAAVRDCLLADKDPAGASVFSALLEPMIVQANAMSRKHQWDQHVGVSTGNEELGRARRHGRNL